jgi:hypothetical protein
MPDTTELFEDLPIETTRMVYPYECTKCSSNAVYDGPATVSVDNQSTDVSQNKTDPKHGTPAVHPVIESEHPGTFYIPGETDKPITAERAQISVQEPFSEDK